MLKKELLFNSDAKEGDCFIKATHVTINKIVKKIKNRYKKFFFLINTIFIKKPP